MRFDLWYIEQQVSLQNGAGHSEGDLFEVENDGTGLFEIEEGDLLCLADGADACFLPYLFDTQGTCGGIGHGGAGSARFEKTQEGLNQDGVRRDGLFGERIGKKIGLEKHPLTGMESKPILFDLFHKPLNGHFRLVIGKALEHDNSFHEDFSFVRSRQFAMPWAKVSAMDSTVRRRLS